jgi:DNA-binding response OmpR family regulator
VEDEETLGDTFRDFLVELGHQPVVARTAEAALGKVQTERLDAILLDLNLPGMSGLDFLQLGPVRESGLPVVAMSGVATEGEAREVLRLGALDFVGKPIPFERLHEMMRFLEPRAHERRRDHETRQAERRRAPRVKVTVPVRIQEFGGATAQGTSLELSPFGIKLRTGAAVNGGAAVRLSFAPPDGGPSVDVIALLLRVDADGLVFAFVQLPPAVLERLTEFVERGLSS